MVFDSAAMIKQHGLPVGAKSNVEGASIFGRRSMDIYCDVCIIILFVQRICITRVLLYAIKYVNVVLCKCVDLV